MQVATGNPTVLGTISSTLQGEGVSFLSVTELSMSLSYHIANE